MWCPGWNPGREEGHEVKSKEISIRCGLELIYQYWLMHEL